MSSLKSRCPLQVLTHLLIALLPYIILNLYLIMFARVFKLSDFAQVPELLDVLSGLELVIYFLPMLIVFALFISNISHLKYKRSLVAFSPLTSLIVLALVFPTQFDVVFKRVGGRVIDWSEQKMAANNGYLITTLFFHARELNNQQTLEQYREGNAWHDAHNKAGWLVNNAQKRNVHWIVLESFFDPKDMANLTFDHATYHPDFVELIDGKNDYLTSSVFGGGTSNAEFELLCGVPAFRALGGVDFNSFTGASTFCNPWFFQQAGWSSINTKAYKPWYFNTFAAYQGLGFEERHFPKSYGETAGESSYLDLVSDEPFLFDGDLFIQNLIYIQSRETPVFNYMLAVYGHNDHYLDESIFPRIIHPTLNNNALSLKASNAINQIYYRSKAISDMVNALKQQDPDALIVLMSDHLPALSGTGFYKGVGYLAGNSDANHQVPAFVFDAGERVILNGKIENQYQLGDLVFDLLSKGKYCQAFDCYQSKEILKSQYFSIMSNAVLAE
jgi:hypothetical protein